MSLRLDRMVRNQLMFREVNDRIAEVAPAGNPVDYLCECSHPECKATIHLTCEEYEAVRSSSNLFVIAPGHEVQEVDRWIGTTGDYSLVEKKAGGANLAHEADPRSRGPGAA
jgi:hypothetical protein